MHPSNVHPNGFFCKALDWRVGGMPSGPSPASYSDSVTYTGSFSQFEEGEERCMTSELRCLGLRKITVAVEEEEGSKRAAISDTDSEKEAND